MKNLLKPFSLLFACIAMLFMYSCQDEESTSQEEQGGVEFLLAGDRVSNAKSGIANAKNDAESCDMALASYAVIEISGDTYEIDLKAWGDSYKTDLIELGPGTYQVTNVQLFDADGHPLYATPMANSEFGPFVSQALPFDVTVENYRKIEYDVEVLCVEEFTPPQFGFVFWDVTIKEVKNLCVFTNFCEPDAGHAVASLEAFIYPNEESTSEEDLIWTGSADGDYDSENPDNELLCLKFPYDPSIPTEDQSFYVELLVNGVLFTGTMPLDRVDMINAEDGYLHLNENCQGDFDIFSTSSNIAWEDLNDDAGRNDGDHNDFIVNVTTFTDITSGDLTFVFEPLARGGGFDHAFRFWLPGNSSNYTISSASSGVSASDVAGNTEVTVYPSTNSAFPSGNDYVNTKCPGISEAGNIVTVTVDVSNASNFVYFLLNPFDANLDVTGGGNTYDLTIGNLFTTSTYTDRDGNQFPNALITPGDYKWLLDGFDIRDHYIAPDYLVPNNNGTDPELWVNSSCGSGS
ncbi:DUF4842 domain-containing protein [Psychroflexus sp. CAK8W]|uniref:DUF4842 domain-containing protein n=1 Tax=Psychroflexus longus TaxID=2873596 RepID=A0ABS7XEN8_9FLAO|nr:DUF4842 domain-containing protein [Psychroflexus longus]MBZ9777404.1 DUF4842 domain-containing protein [Psychroflexus longus]